MTAAERIRVGRLLKKARLKLKKRQLDIAAETGCTQVAVQGWESGKWLPENFRLRNVAAAYGVDPLELLPPPQKSRQAKGRAAKRAA